MGAKPTRRAGPPMNVRFPPRVGRQLEQFAELVDSPKSAVVVRAVEEYLAWRVPQQADLRRALKAAETAKLIDNKAVVDWLEQFIKRHAR